MVAKYIALLAVAVVVQAINSVQQPEYKPSGADYVDGDDYASSAESHSGYGHARVHKPHFNAKAAVCDRDFLKFVTESASHFQSSIARAYQNFQSKFAISGGLSGGIVKGQLLGSFKDVLAQANGKSGSSVDSFPVFGKGQVTKENAHAYFEAEARVLAAEGAVSAALAVDNTARGFVPVVKLLVKSFLIALKAQIAAVCNCKGYGMHYTKSCPYWDFLEHLKHEFHSCADGYILDMDVKGAHNDAIAAEGNAVKALKALSLTDWP